MSEINDLLEHLLKTEVDYQERVRIVFLLQGMPV